METEIERLRQEVVVLREKQTRGPDSAEKPETSEHSEKRRALDKLLTREKEIERLRGRLEGALDDNRNLKLMLQSREESKANQTSGARDKRRVGRR